MIECVRACVHVFECFYLIFFSPVLALPCNTLSLKPDMLLSFQKLARGNSGASLPQFYSEEHFIFLAKVGCSSFHVLNVYFF